MSISVKLRPAKNFALALVALSSILAMTDCALAQRIEKTRADRVAPARANAANQARTKDATNKTPTRTAGAQNDTRFSGGTEQRGGNSSARLAAGTATSKADAACVNCPTPVAVRRRDRDCILPKYPQDRHVQTGSLGPTRCDRK